MNELFDRDFSHFAFFSVLRSPPPAVSALFVFIFMELYLIIEYDLFTLVFTFSFIISAQDLQSEKKMVGQAEKPENKDIHLKTAAKRSIPFHSIEWKNNSMSKTSQFHILSFLLNGKWSLLQQWLTTRQNNNGTEKKRKFQHK